MLYLDLDELPRLFRRRWLWSVERPNIASFRRADHYGDPGVPLDQAIRDLVESRTGHRPGGPVRLLTHLRYFGVGFNPVSFYYCFDQSGERLESVVAEVNNTPWGERHCYVIDRRDAHDGSRLHDHAGKAMHVSPFMEMDMRYDFRLATPGERLDLHIGNLRDGAKLFDATLGLRRREITARGLAMALLQFPLMTWKVLAAIHFEALRLWLKGVPLVDHPGKTTPETVNRS